MQYSFYFTINEIATVRTWCLEILTCDSFNSSFTIACCDTRLLSYHKVTTVNSEVITTMYLGRENRMTDPV
jgi:hypothetical protein